MFDQIFKKVTADIDGVLSYSMANLEYDSAVADVSFLVNKGEKDFMTLMKNQGCSNTSEVKKYILLSIIYSCR